MMAPGELVVVSATVGWRNCSNQRLPPGRQVQRAGAGWGWLFVKVIGT